MSKSKEKLVSRDKAEKTPEPLKKKYFLPDYGKTVLAASLDEAVELAKNSK